MEDFADRLRHARKMRNLSQAALARASGLSQGAIASYENRSRKTTTGIIQLADALKVNPAWLSMGTGPLEPTLESGFPASASARLSDKAKTTGLAAWPFENIKPADYWSLAKAQRQIIEQTMATLVDALRQQNSDKKSR